MQLFKEPVPSQQKVVDSGDRASSSVIVAFVYKQGRARIV